MRVVDPDLTERMSEWVVMHALAHLRQLRRYERQQRERIWADDDDQPKAAEVQVGVLGLGVLGTRRRNASSARSASRSPAGARAQKSLPGRRLLLRARRPEAPARDDRHAGRASAADRRHARPHRRFAPGQLRRGGRLGGPILINAGRGGLQVEADILAALDSRRLKGASLDVFEREPLPKNSRLWTHPAVYVSPHNAAVSTPEAVAAFVARQIEAHERGEPLTNLVDRRRGY